MGLKTDLATVAKRVDFDPLTDPDSEFGAATLQPSDEARVRVRER